MVANRNKTPFLSNRGGVFCCLCQRHLKGVMQKLYNTP